MIFAGRAIKDEADTLLRQFGPAAYPMAREAMREARRRKELRLARFYAKVSLEIARRAKREVGLDTATRYLDAP